MMMFDTVNILCKFSPNVHPVISAAIDILPESMIALVAATWEFPYIGV